VACHSRYGEKLQALRQVVAAMDWVKLIVSLSAWLSRKKIADCERLEEDSLALEELVIEESPVLMVSEMRLLFLPDSH